MVEKPVFPVHRTAELILAEKGTTFQRLTTAIKKHKLAAAASVMVVAFTAAAIVYSTRPGEAIDSVAVMPFVNVSGDPNTEYLSEGITDNLIDRLSHLPNLKRVVAPNRYYVTKESR